METEQTKSTDVDIEETMKKKQSYYINKLIYLNQLLEKEEKTLRDINQLIEKAEKEENKKKNTLFDVVFHYFMW
jgi:maltose-binding protein MalE